LLSPTVFALVFYCIFKLLFGYSAASVE